MSFPFDLLTVVLKLPLITVNVVQICDAHGRQSKILNKNTKFSIIEIYSGVDVTLLEQMCCYAF